MGPHFLENFTTKGNSKLCHVSKKGVEKLSLEQEFETTG